jgi:Ser/Thr protein kinase RdoA (MazF antagonist)
MFLTASNLAHYLIGRGTLAAGAVVDGDFVVAEAGRRNRNYKVLQNNSPGLFIKQIRNADPMAVSTLQREAACYRLALQNPDYSHLAELMPRFIDHDPNRHILIFELLANGENLSEHHTRLRAFPNTIGALLGEALGRYHRTLRGKPLRQEDLAHFPRQPPWIFSFHNSHNQMTALSGGATQLAEIIKQYPDLYFNLERLRQSWSYDSIIHGDMKWDNCLLYSDEHGNQQLKVIDWELVDYGDASWDVGAILQAYLTFCIYSMPFYSETVPDRLLAGAGYSLESTFPAIRAFWQSYRTTSGLPAEQAYYFLLRCVEHAAARMVQTSFEWLYHTPAINNQCAIILQTAMNILRNPQEAAANLFGLTKESA